MVQSTTGRQPSNIEREILAEARSLHDPRSFASPTADAPRMAMPDYVEHRDGATEIGKLSAEAVVREYEATAKEIESIGVDLVERA
jgi:hypothetical protein